MGSWMMIIILYINVELGSLIIEQTLIHYIAKVGTKMYAGNYNIFSNNVIVLNNIFFVSK